MDIKAESAPLLGTTPWSARGAVIATSCRETYVHPVKASANLLATSKKFAV